MYLVYGTGLSGLSAAKLLQENGESGILFDENEAAKDPHIEGFTLYKKEIPTDIEDKLTTIVLSPGVPTDLPRIQKWREKGLRIIGEIELAYTYAKGHIVGITGTNGKTTTTSLVGFLLEKENADVRVVGNIGIPYTGISLQTTDDTVVVCEISSFQLETIDTFRPHISAILNITPDHLDRHHTMEAYIKAKEEIAIYQEAGDVCILNYEDDVLREFGKTLSCKVIYFSSKRALSDGLYLEGDTIVFASENRIEPVIRTTDLQLVGTHNYENVMAAVACVYSYGMPMEKIQKYLKEFKAVAHRMEYVSTVNGVTYYNDSKGTNPDAAIKAIDALSVPTYLIAGGYDKGADYDEWISHFFGKVKKLLLIGQTAKLIDASARRLGFTDICHFETMEEAINFAHEHALKGEAVLLSPACASWGMFKDYNERGDRFKEYVRGL